MKISAHIMYTCAHSSLVHNSQKVKHPWIGEQKWPTHTKECYSAIKTTQYLYMPQHVQALKTQCQGADARHNRSHLIWSHLYQMFAVGKSMETKVELRMVRKRWGKGSGCRWSWRLFGGWWKCCKVLWIYEKLHSCTLKRSKVINFVMNFISIFKI